MGLISCGQAKREKYNDLAAAFLNKVKTNDLIGARKMIKADLKDIAKDSLIFISDMNIVQRLIDKNGFPREYKIEEFDHGVILCSINVNLGSRGNELVKEYILQLYFLRGADPNTIYGYSLERIFSE